MELPDNMRKLRFSLERLAFLMDTWIVYQNKDGTLLSNGTKDLNPVVRSEHLREKLRLGALSRDIPYILRDEYEVYFACIREAEGFLYVGPLASMPLDRVQRHRFYQLHQVKMDTERNITVHETTEIYAFIGTIANLVTGKECSERELVEGNGLTRSTVDSIREEQIRYTLQEDEEQEYRHSYMEEKEMLDMIREGLVNEAMKRSKRLDLSVGKLGNNDADHWRNILIIASTLCSRAAIQGGVAPHIAYRISGFYINQGMRCKDVNILKYYKNAMTEEMTRLVGEERRRIHASNYVKQCKDYIAHHYREKIYLADIADHLGISEGHLSRLFRQETGMSIPDYINDVKIRRAANLLAFSNETIASIAEYVNYPTSSYFSKIFRERMKMTPREYRDRYKPAEFSQSNSNR